MTSKVNDPKLPSLPLYIVPKHVWEDVAADEMSKYAGSGRCRVRSLHPGRVEAGPVLANGGEPQFLARAASAIDEVVFRVFRNGDAMVAALKSGEIDAAMNVPEAAFPDLESTDGIVAVAGEQGGFDDLVLNSYDGKPPRDTSKFDAPHPVLTDPRFRQAIAHAIDKQTLVDRVLAGLATPGTTMSPSPNPAWIPELTADETYDFDLDQAKQILDDAGYTDSDGNGIREYEGKDIVLRYAIRTESPNSKPYAEFITGWMKDIGIGTTLSIVRRRAADRGHRQGQLRPLRLGVDAVRRS